MVVPNKINSIKQNNVVDWLQFVPTTLGSMRLEIPQVQSACGPGGHVTCFCQLAITETHISASLKQTQFHPAVGADAAPVCYSKPILCLQAESDHHVRDAYNYMTVQTDIALPARQIKVVQDSVRQAAWGAAITHTVARIRGRDMDCRVLDLGAGAGKSTI